MQTFWSQDQLLHHGLGEFTDGRWLPCFEVPRRAELVLAAIQATGLGPVLAPEDHGRGPIDEIHDPRLVVFLERAFELWRASGRAGDALPMTWPTRSLRDIEPAGIDGRLGYWCFDAGTPIGSSTWRSARASAQTAIGAAAAVAAGEGSAFALCRPPGHHAARDAYGGYCFLNNAALAAQRLRNGGAERVAVLDIDYHHGNGTQQIFYGRGDVLFVSLHADPAQEYPFFLGYADEQGVGAGEGLNRNMPLPLGTAIDGYLEALRAGLDAIARFGAAALVVSLGVDTYVGDPISHFRLQAADFPKLGAAIARLRLPTVFVMEGGYAVEPIGQNVVGVLHGFADA